jgi:hypothetical protein
VGRCLRGDQTWQTFVRNHGKELVSVDFFAVPTAAFRVPYVFLVLAHVRRRVLHFNITDSPLARWTAQQLVEAFPYSHPHRYVLQDRDRILWSGDPSSCLFLRPGAKAQSSSFTVAEPFLGAPDRLHPTRVSGPRAGASCRTSSPRVVQLLQLFPPASRRLARDCPEPPVVKPSSQGYVALPLLGGLHRRYTRQAA